MIQRKQLDLATHMPAIHSSIVHMLDHTCSLWGQQTAIVFGEQRLTYFELRSCVIGLAQALRNAGVEGQRVATILPNSITACIAPYAIAAAGAQHIPMNAQYTARELSYMLKDAAPSMVLIDDTVWHKVTPLLTDLPSCKSWTSSEVLFQIPAWLKTFQEANLVALYPANDTPALLQYTGGSSGFPKGVHLSHHAISTNVSQREGLLPVTPGQERVLCVMPLFHSYAMAMGLFLCGYSGSTLVVLPAYHPERVLEAIEKYQITIFPGSPTIFTGLMSCDMFIQTDWRSVHTCYSGSAALQAETMRRWQEATHAPIYEGYGQTEAGPVLTFNPAQGPIKIASVGIPVPCTEVQVVDLETGMRVLPFGEHGEIRARGPQVMLGYHGLAQENNETLREGWLYTGDIGEFDEDGYLFIRDRKKDMVIVSGYNVYPREVEEVLFTHPDVLDAAVIGQKDAYRGEVLLAFVVLREGGVFSAKGIQDFCALHLARYKIPYQVEILSALPKTSVNKTDKKVLKKSVSSA
jgi:long-chain acyl-CoA synthetase